MAVEMLAAIDASVRKALEPWVLFTCWLGGTLRNGCLSPAVLMLCRAVCSLGYSLTPCKLIASGCGGNGGWSELPKLLRLRSWSTCSIRGAGGGVAGARPLVRARCSSMVWIPSCARSCWRPRLCAPACCRKSRV